MQGILMEDFIIEKYIREIGVTAFAIFSYIRLRANGKLVPIRLSEIIYTLGISKPMVISHLKQLRKYKMIRIDTKIEGGKKLHFMKDNSGKVFLPLPAKDNTNHLIVSKKDPEGVNKDYKELHDHIINELLKHPRYHNDYYLKRKYKFGKKEETHIIEFQKRIKNPDAYIQWFLKKKASRSRGMNIGFVAHVPMLEEYLIERDGELKNYEKTEKKTKKVSKIKLEMARSLVKEIREGKKLNKEDNDFLQQCLQSGLIKKDGGDFVMRSE